MKIKAAISILDRAIIAAEIPPDHEDFHDIEAVRERLRVTGVAMEAARARLEDAQGGGW